MLIWQQFIWIVIFFYLKILKNYLSYWDLHRDLSIFGGLTG